MSFKSYALHAQPDGSRWLDDPQPLVFSGRNGLIARFVLTAGERASESWRLHPDELHALASPALQAGERMIIFEQTEEDELEILVLEAIHGISDKRTEMMFSFRPLVVVARSPILQVRELAVRKTYTEELALDGGLFAPTASWHWCRPHLAIGGVVVGGSVNG